MDPETRRAVGHGGCMDMSELPVGTKVTVFDLASAQEHCNGQHGVISSFSPGEGYRVHLELPPQSEICVSRQTLLIAADVVSSEAKPNAETESQTDSDEGEGEGMRSGSDDESDDD